MTAFYQPTQVLRKKSELKGSIKQFELEFYQQNHKLPNACNNEHYNSLLRKLKYVKWLLSMWKIRPLQVDSLFPIALET